MLKLYLLEASHIKKLSVMLSVEIPQTLLSGVDFTLPVLKILECKTKRLRTTQGNEGYKGTPPELLFPSGTEERTMKQLQRTSSENSTDSQELLQHLSSLPGGSSQFARNGHAPKRPSTITASKHRVLGLLETAQIKGCSASTNSWTVSDSSTNKRPTRLNLSLLTYNDRQGSLILWI